MILATVAGLGSFFLIFLKSQRFVHIKCHLQDSLFFNVLWCKKCDSWCFVMQVLRYSGNQTGSLVLMMGLSFSWETVVTLTSVKFRRHGQRGYVVGQQLQLKCCKMQKAKFLPLLQRLPLKIMQNTFQKFCDSLNFCQFLHFYRNSLQYDAIFIVYNPPQLDWELLKIPDMLTMTSSHSYLQKRIALVWTNWSFKMVRRMIRTQR